MDTVENIRAKFVALRVKNSTIKDKTGVEVLELIGAQFIADQDRIFGKLNVDYAERELAWYKSMSRNVHDLPPPVPKIWLAAATPKGEINSNYGWAIWSPDNFSQYDNVLKELQRDPNSRRAQMIYTRPSMWMDYNRDGMSDFMCTTAVQYFIRNGKLITYVTMRSNDVVFGYKSDLHWQKHVSAELLKGLPGITQGSIIWNVASLHVYSRHFELIDECIQHYTGD